MANDYFTADQTGIDVRALLASVWARKLRILLVTLALLAITYVILMFVPRVYESSAAILVEPRTNAYTQAQSTSTVPTVQVLDDTQISSQIELIKSRDTLLRVIESEKLREVPEFNGSGNSPIGSLLGLVGRSPALIRNVDEVVLVNLDERLTVVRQRDSLVITITVRSNDPALAARLANAIANAHVLRRTELSLSDTVEASEWLAQQIDTLRARVTQAEGKVAQFRIDNDLFQGTNQTSLLDQQLSAVSAQISATQERKNTAQSRANLIRGLISAGQPLDAVSDVRESIVIQQLSQQQATLQGERAQRLATLLPDHPTVQALTAQITEIDKQIKLEARRVADALDAEAQIEADLERSLQADLARLKASASTATTETVSLDELEREAKAERDVLESYLLRYRDAISRTDTNSALPDVRVITMASPSLAPVAPRTSMILIAVALVSLALQVGSILFSEMLADRPRVVERQVHLPRPARPSKSTQVRMQRAKVVNAPQPDLGLATFGAKASVADVPPGPVEAPVAESVPQQAMVVEDVEVTTVEAVAPAPTLAVEEEQAEVIELSGPIYPAAELTEATPETAAPEEELEVTESVPPSEARPQAEATVVAPVAADEVAQDEPLETETPVEPNEPVAPVRQGAPPVFIRTVAPAMPRVQPGRDLATLSADLALGRIRVVLVTSMQSAVEAAAVTESLVSDALLHGLSVVRVDAGSGRPSVEPGLTDLSADQASFGDVVHRSTREGLAEVPWGHRQTIIRRSHKPATLIEALSDIYEVVLVNAGEFGMASSLPVFASFDCFVALVVNESTSKEAVDAARSDIRALGFTQVARMHVFPVDQTEVA